MNEAYAFPSFTTKVTPKALAPSGAPVQLVGLGTHIGIVISSTVLQSDINAEFNSTVSAGSFSDQPLNASTDTYAGAAQFSSFSPSTQTTATVAQRTPNRQSK